MLATTAQTSDAQKMGVTFVKVYRALLTKEYRNMVFYGGRGSGKSQHVAIALLSRGRAEKLRILCTREIQKTLSDSVHKLLKDMISKYGMTDYEVLDKTIRNKNTGTEFIFSGLRHNVNEIKSMEGIDICWVEEAQSITEQSLKVLSPTIRKEGSQIIFTFNRLNERDPVYVRYVLNRRGNTYVKKVNYDVLIEAGLFPETLRLEMEEDKAESPETFAHVWLGEPLAQTERSILNRGKVMDAMGRTTTAEGRVIIGVDVARLGGDRTVFWKRKGLKSLDKQVFQKMRLTEQADRLEEFANYEKKRLPNGDENPNSVLLQIDDTGVGGGLTDIMIERGYDVRAINFGGAPEDKDKYPNWISEAWFYIDTILDEAEIINDNDLLMELTTRQWKQDSRGRRAVESKDEYKKRGYRSPDLADAMIICYYSPAPHVVEWASPRF